MDRDRKNQPMQGIPDLNNRQTNKYCVFFYMYVCIQAYKLQSK